MSAIFAAICSKEMASNALDTEMWIQSSSRGRVHNMQSYVTMMYTQTRGINQLN